MNKMELLSADKARDIQKTEGKAYHKEMINRKIKYLDLAIKGAASHDKDYIYKTRYELESEIYDLLKKRGYKITEYRDDYGTVKISW